MHTPQSTCVHVGVDLCGRDVRVAEHLLDVAQARASFQEVCGKRVPEHVRVDRKGRAWRGMQQIRIV